MCGCSLHGAPNDSETVQRLYPSLPYIPWATVKQVPRGGATWRGRDGSYLILAEELGENHLCELAPPSAHGVVWIALVKHCGVKPLEGWSTGVGEMDRVLGKGCVHLALSS